MDYVVKQIPDDSEILKAALLLELGVPALDPSTLKKKDGYLFYGARPLHRMLYEREYGDIPYGWVVHHIDFDKQNNNLANLISMPAYLHSKLHAYMAKIGAKLNRQALIPIIENYVKIQHILSVQSPYKRSKKKRKRKD